MIVESVRRLVRIGVVLVDLVEEVGRLANACGALGATKRGPMEGAAFREDVERLMHTSQ